MTRNEAMAMILAAITETCPDLTISAESLAVNSKLHEMGLDSSDRMSVLSILEQNMGLCFDEKQAAAAMTADDLVSLLLSQEGIR